MVEPALFRLKQLIWHPRPSLSRLFIAWGGLSLLTLIELVSSTAIAQTLEQPQSNQAPNHSLSESESESDFATSIQFNPPPPPKTGAPVGRSHGGGVRSGLCVVDDAAVDSTLTALVPAYDWSAATDSSLKNSATFQLVWSYTTQDHPTFWFYLPYALQGQTEVLFVLQELQTDQPQGTVQTIHEATFYPTLSPGLVRVTLPEDLAPLTTDQAYNWSFQVYCMPDDPDFVEGWIYRTQPDTGLAEQLQMATPEDQVQLHAAAGLWQDALMGMVQLLETEESTQPSEMQSTDSGVWVEWRSLLDSVGLGDLADKPFVDCCEIEEGRSPQP